jgi:hypothetical protein
VLAFDVVGGACVVVDAFAGFDFPGERGFDFDFDFGGAKEIVLVVGLNVSALPPQPARSKAADATTASCLVMRIAIGVGPQR